MRRLGFEETSLFEGADASRVWSRIVSWEGINEELAPIRMSHPACFPTVASIPADDTAHFVSTLSLWGLPFDRHRLALRALEPGKRFHEVSSNLLMQRWEHERTLQTVAGGVRVTDRCSFEARLAFLGPLLLAIYRRVFTRRHRRLRRHFAAAR